MSFTDGSTATGSFIFNADTFALSSISISKAGGAFAPVSYTTTTQYTSVVSNYFEFGTRAVLTTDDFFIDLVAATALTNAGGVVGLIAAVDPLNFGVESFFGRCLDVNCAFGVDTGGLRTGASLVGQQVGAVPEPATLLLVLGAGVGALASRRRQPRGWVSTR